MTILATVVVLGVLIFVHELGHFWAAKLVDIEVERFSIGLGPRVWGFQKGETEYVISAIPLGGYVKMAGMEDEIMEAIEGGPGDEPRQPSPRDFDAKSLPARAFVISAGVIMNMLFAFVVYVGTTAGWGVPEQATTRVAEVDASALPAGAEGLAELPRGATLERIDDYEIQTWADIARAFREAGGGAATVVTRDPSGSWTVTLPDDPEERYGIISAFTVFIEPVAGAIEPGSPADRADIEAGDRFVAIDGIEVETWQEFVAQVRERPGQRAELRIERQGGELTRFVELDAVEENDPETGAEIERGRIGVVVADAADVEYRPVGLAQSVVIGWQQTVFVTGIILDFLRDLVTGGVSPRSVGSIVTIGQASGQAAAQGVVQFLEFMALFSINLAILNLLPIPVLDGGHLVFLTIEGVRGRALSVEQRLRWSNVGFIVILGLMVWALSNDVLRLLGL